MSMNCSQTTISCRRSAILDTLDQPRPGLDECMDLLVERCAELGEPWVRPSPPLNLDALIEKIAALPHPPDAIEARRRGPQRLVARQVKRRRRSGSAGTWKTLFILSHDRTPPSNIALANSQSPGASFVQTFVSGRSRQHILARRGHTSNAIENIKFLTKCR